MSQTTVETAPSSPQLPAPLHEGNGRKASRAPSVNCVAGHSARPRAWGSTSHTTVIEPQRGWQLLRIKELWRFRELLFYLTWRDVKIRYKQTFLGAAWAIIQPVMMMIIFTIFLGRMARVSSGDFPYPVFVYAGLLPWTFFATAIASAANSVVAAREVVTKVYFPRLIIPFASIGAAMVDFAIAFSVLAGLMLWYGLTPNWYLLLLPVLLLFTVMAALGVGNALAALNVSFRDFKYTLPFLVQIWMFATPTVYMHIDADGGQTEDRPAVVAADSSAPLPAASAPQEEATWKETAATALLRLNPMTGLIACFRAATLGGTFPWTSFWYAAAVTLAVFLAGTFYFRRMEGRFADVI